MCMQRDDETQVEDPQVQRRRDEIQFELKQAQDRLGKTVAALYIIECEEDERETLTAKLEADEVDQRQYIRDLIEERNKLSTGE